MTTPLRLTPGAAALVGMLLGVADASAGTKRPWVDPPASLGSEAPSNPAVKSPAPPASSPEVSQSAPDKPDVVSTGSVAAPAVAPTPKAAAVPAISPPAAAPVRKAIRQPASQKVRVREAKSVPPSVNDKAVSPRRQTARALPRQRGPDSGRALELMTLQTIQLSDGRRLEVLTRPDERTVETLLLGP